MSIPGEILVNMNTWRIAKWQVKGYLNSLLSYIKAFSVISRFSHLEETKLFLLSVIGK